MDKALDRKVEEFHRLNEAIQRTRYPVLAVPALIRAGMLYREIRKELEQGRPGGRQHSADVGGAKGSQ